MKAFVSMLLLPWSLAAGPTGKMRLEGKDYVVRDRDVMYFRFNV